MKNDLAILILAAGTSSRLGEPKQLVKYKEETLLYNSCKKTLSLKAEVFVVLGSHFTRCKKEIEDLDINIIENKDYKNGLSSSLIKGISKVQNYEKVLVLLCDQPFIPKTHLDKLIEESKKTDKIICSFYENSLGVPALFPKKVFSSFLELKGDKGAKAIISKFDNLAITLEDNLSLDIDIQEDKKYLI